MNYGQRWSLSFSSAVKLQTSGFHVSWCTTSETIETEHHRVPCNVASLVQHGNVEPQGLGSAPSWRTKWISTFFFFRWKPRLKFAIFHCPFQLVEVSIQHALYPNLCFTVGTWFPGSWEVDVNRKFCFHSLTWSFHHEAHLRSDVELFYKTTP